jgi:hypothetical protein
VALTASQGECELGRADRSEMWARRASKKSKVNLKKVDLTELLG